MAIRAYSEGLAREASIVGDFVQRWDDDRHSTRPSDQSSRRGIRRLNWRVDEEKGKGSRRGEARRGTCPCLQAMYVGALRMDGAADCNLSLGDPPAGLER